MRRSVVFVLTSFICTVAGAATSPVGPVPTQSLYAPQGAPALDQRGQRVTTNGGRAHLRLDAGLLGDMGLRIRGADGKLFGGDYAHFDFTLAKGSRFEFDAHPKAVLGIAGGGGQLVGGVEFQGKSSRISWQAPRFVVRAGNPPRIDLVSADGDVLFYVDKLMYQMLDGDRTFSITTADLHMSRLLAERIGNLAFADHYVGDISITASMDAPITVEQPKSCAVPNWPKTDVPGQPGQKFEADVFMTTFNGVTLGACQTGCDGPGLNNTGSFKMAPSSSLRNNVAQNGVPAQTVADPLGTSTSAFTAEVPWQDKFSGSFPPYGVDQHPYLIWNVYRLDTNGQITQIGRSGVKHAFLTVNSACAEPCGNNQILGRGCGDTYGTGNNDSPNDLGPRSELEPASGRWGRCRSIYDPNCNGSDEDFGGYGTFVHRMMLREQDVDLTLNPGATFLFDSWYIVRDDINIYNTMASRPVTFTWSGANWTTTNQSPLQLGSTLDRWYAARTGTKVNTEIVAIEGHTKVAVNATDLGGGNWRYDYVVMNFDFARTVTTGTPPNLEMVRNNGFKRFTISRSPIANIASTQFADGDASAANDWAVDTSSPTTITWTAPNDASSLNWGTMFRFSVASNVAPANADAVLEVTEPGSPTSYNAASLGVGNDVLLLDGFED